MRYKSLDGLRGYASMLVVISHYSATYLFGGFLMRSGQLGVMIFFALSGFLMGRLYSQTAFTSKNVGRFYMSRIARVFPLYILLVLTSFWLFSVNGDPWPGYPIGDDSLLNHLLFWRGKTVLWTIPVEVQFYAVFPLIWLAYQRVGPVVSLWLCMVSALVAWLNYPFTPAVLHCLPYFLGGVVCAWLEKSIDWEPKSFNLLFWCAMALPFLSLKEIVEAIGVGNYALWESPGLIFVVPILVIAVLRAPIANVLFGNPLARFLGSISYSMYLLHMPISRIVTYYLWLPPHHYSTAAIAILATIAASWASFRLIEAPAQRLIKNGFGPALVKRPRPT